MTDKAKKPVAGRGGDGVAYLGLRNGRKWWQARLYWRDDATGKLRERRATFQADSKPLAMMQRSKLLEAARDGVAVSKTRARFRDIAREYVASIDVRSTQFSKASLERCVNKHFGDHYLDAVTPRLMQEYLDSLTIKSVNNVRNYFVCVFRHAVRKHVITDNPAKRLERKRERRSSEDADAMPRALTAEQVGAYFDDLEQHEPDLYPLVFTQFMLGCRFAEASALRRSDVDLESGIVRIRRGQYRGTTGSTKGKEARKAAISLEGRAFLRRHLDRMAHEQWPGWDELLFPRPPSRRQRTHDFWGSTAVNSAIRRSFERAGIVVKGASHTARHTMITLAADAAAEAVMRKFVGHRSAAVHLGYQETSDAKVLQLADIVARKLLQSRTGTKTGTQGTANVDVSPKNKDK